MMDLNNSYNLPIVELIDKFRFEEKNALSASLLKSSSVFSPN